MWSSIKISLNLLSCSSIVLLFWTKNALQFMTTAHHSLISSSGSAHAFKTYPIQSISFSCICNHKELVIMLCDPFINKTMSSLVLNDGTWTLNELVCKTLTSWYTFADSMIVYSPTSPRNFSDSVISSQIEFFKFRW